MERLEHITAVAFPVVAINCDTDQIIPARFLQKPRSDNFGDYLFRALRFNKDGTEQPEAGQQGNAARSPGFSS